MVTLCRRDGLFDDIDLVFFLDTAKMSQVQGHGVGNQVGTL